MQELGFANVQPVGGTAALGPGQVRQKSTVKIRFHLAPGVGQALDQTGGTVSLAQGQVRLSFPTGALSGTTFISAAPAGNLLPVGGPAVVQGTAWEFGPTGTQFPKPVTMTIAYDPAQLPAGTLESDLRIHTLVNGQYVQQNAGLVDLVNHTVSAQVTSFSTYVLVTRLFPGSQQDVTGPQVQVVDIFDPVTNLPTSALALDLSGADANVRVRIAATDNIVGVQSLEVVFANGDAPRRRCSAFTRVSGSDTNGIWECVIPWFQYNATGTFAAAVISRDRLGNMTVYSPTAQPALACAPSGLPACVAVAPITITGVPSDVTPPVIVSIEVSADVQPRTWSPTVSLDVGNTSGRVVLGMRVTDDLSGLLGPNLGTPGTGLFLSGPSGQSVGTSCQLVQGSALDAFVECTADFPQNAAAGTWTIGRLTFPDRVRNAQTFRTTGVGSSSGTVCDELAPTVCLSGPTIQITGAGDGTPAALQSIGLSSSIPRRLTSP